MQSKKLSAVEAGVNVSVGFILGVACNYVLLPVIGSGLGPAVALTLAFTVLSYARQYFFRRLFNSLTTREA